MTRSTQRKKRLNMKKLRLALLSAIVVSTLLGSVFTVLVLRPSSAAPAPAVTFEYRAKWICNLPDAAGIIQTSAAQSIGLVPGEYKTDINVHNPSHSVTLTIVKKFVFSVVEIAEPRTHLNATVRTVLQPDGAFFIDCVDIFAQLSQGNPGIAVPSFGKGFVVLSTLSSAGTVTGFSSPNSLDVVGEYSAESFAPAAVPTPYMCTFLGALFPCISTGISLDVVPIPAAPFVA